MTAVPPRWRFCRTFSLDSARMRARRGDVVGAVGQAAKAAMEGAHAVLCERSRWALNETRLLRDAGLDGLHALLANVPGEPDTLVRWVDAVAEALGVPAGEVRPWA